MEFESGSVREKINSFVLDISTGNVVLDLGKEHLTISKNLRNENQK